MARFTEERMFEKLGDISSSKKTRIKSLVCPPGYYYDKSKDDCVKIEFLYEHGLPDKNGNIKYRNTFIKGYNYPKDTNAAQAWEVQKNQFPYAAEDVDSWYNTWYAQRMAKPEFAQLAQQRLEAAVDGETPYILQATPTYQKEDHGGGYATTYIKKVNDPANKPYENKIVVNGSIHPDSGSNDLYNSMMANPFEQRDYLFKELLHEKTHWDDNNYPQVGTSRHDISKDEVLNSALPKEYLKVNPEGSVYHWDENENLLPFKFDEGLPEEQLEYLSRPTEVRARLNVWRQYNNISPTKDYHPSEIKRIIDGNVKHILNNPDTVNPLDYRNILELYQIIHGDPKVLKELHDRYVFTDPKKELDTAEYGGITKYPDGGLVQLDRVPGARFKKNSSGTWVYESGAPITDQLILQELNYGKGKPVGSPVMQGLPAPDIRTTDMKIQAVKNQGMAYQSTADQLKVLQQQKDREIAQQKAEQKRANSQMPTDPFLQKSETLQQVAAKMVPQSEQQWADFEFVKQDTAKRKSDLISLFVLDGYTPEEAASIVGSYGSDWASLEQAKAKDLQQMRTRSAMIAAGENPDSMKQFTPRAPQAWNDRMQDLIFNPFTSVGYLMRGQEIPEYLQEKVDNGTLGYWANGQFVQGRNLLDTAVDIATPIGWAHSGQNIIDRATNDKSGDFWTEENAWDALNVMPALGLAKGAKVVQGLEAANNTTALSRLGNTTLDLAQRTKIVPKSTAANLAIDAGSIIREPFYAPQRPSFLNPAAPPIAASSVPNQASLFGGLKKFFSGKSGLSGEEAKLIDEIAFEELMKLTPEQELILEKLSKTNPDYNIRMIPLLEEDATRGLIAMSDDMKMGSKTNLDAWPVLESSESLPLNRASQKQAFDDATAFSKEWVLGENVDKYDQLASARSSIETVMPDVVVQRNLAEARYKDLSKKFLDPNESKIIKAKEEWLRRNGYDPAIMSSIPTDPKIFELLKDLRFGVHDDEIYRIIGETDPNLSLDLQRVSNAQKKLDTLNNTLTQLHDDAKFIKGEFENLQVDPRFEDKVKTIYKEATPDGSFYRPINTGSNISELRIESRPKLVYPDELEPSFMEMTQSDKDYIKKNLDRMNGSRTNSSTFTLGSRPQSKSYLAEATPIEGGQPIYSDVTLFDMRTPEAAAGTNAHEIGHDFQKLFKGYDTAHAPGDLKNILEGWIGLLQKYDKEDYGYYIPRDDNPIARLFKDALVDPVKKAPGSDEHEYDTWLSGPGELHSDLMRARYELVKILQKQREALKQDTSLKATVEFLKDNEDYYLQWLSENDVINRHFKSTTDPDTKKLILKYLPMLVPAVGAGAAASMGNESLPENKYGGNIKNLSKFIRK